MSFIQKYTPTTLEKTIYNGEFIDFLNTLIEIDDINIILLGKQGQGKSTVISCILNKYYGCGYQDNNEIMYIDNLKEEGITFFRNEIKNFCQMSTSSFGKKKTVVIDDLDMLHEKNQQILRSLIDTYSHNVNFICSSASTNKIINNIQSRLNIIKIPEVTNKELHIILERVSEEQELKFNTSSKRLLINICDNSINLLYTNLEKLKLYVMSFGEEVITIDCNLVNKVCSKMCLNDFYMFTKLWYKEGDITQAFNLIANIYKKGYSLMDIYENYFNYLKLTSVIGPTKKMFVLPLLCKYITCAQETNDSIVELFIFTNDLGRSVSDE